MVTGEVTGEVAGLRSVRARARSMRGRRRFGDIHGGGDQHAGDDGQPGYDARRGDHPGEAHDADDGELGAQFDAGQFDAGSLRNRSGGRSRGAAPRSVRRLSRLVRLHRRRGADACSTTSISRIRPSPAVSRSRSWRPSTRAGSTRPAPRRSADERSQQANHGAGRATVRCRVVRRRRRARAARPDRARSAVGGVRRRPVDRRSPTSPLRGDGGQVERRRRGVPLERIRLGVRDVDRCRRHAT